MELIILFMLICQKFLINTKKQEQNVRKGQLIAKSSTSYHCGSSIRAHLHVGISYDSNGKFPEKKMIEVS